MKEYPIIFTAESVRAILDGRKTQTRRVIKPQPEFEAIDDIGGYALVGKDAEDFEDMVCRCSYGQSGDFLWVRETFFPFSKGQIAYKADGLHPHNDLTWRVERWQSPIFMPRWASRILLRVVNVWPERLQDISRGDALREGLPSFFSNLGYTRSDPRQIFQVSSRDEGGYTNPVEAFENWWNSIYAKRGYGWDVNPWVLVREFEIAEANR